jgi:hypothetical protein
MEPHLEGAAVMTIHEVLSNSQNDTSASGGNRPAPSQRASYLRCQQSGDTLLNRGASGATAEDQSFATYALPARATDTKVYFLDLLTNDMYFRPRTAAGKRWFQNFLTACVSHAVMGMKQTARTGANSTTGVWSNTQVDSLGMQTTAAGAAKTFYVSGKAVVVCWLADNHASSQGRFEVWIDDDLVDTIDTYTGTDLSPYGTTPNGLRYGHAARIYDGYSDARHIVSIKSIVGGSAAYLSYVAGTNEQPITPKVFIGTGAKIGGVPDAETAPYRQIVLDLVTRLSEVGIRAKAIDTWSALDPALHLMPDGIHWNSAGQIVVRDLMTAAESEPKELRFQTQRGTNLVIRLDPNGIVTSYTEL